jgi:ATP-dependent RNA helicase RhlE
MKPYFFLIEKLIGLRTENSGFEPDPKASTQPIKQGQRQTLNLVSTQMKARKQLRASNSFWSEI